MSTHKSIVMLPLLLLALFVNVADARSSRQAVGRVTQTHGASIELQLFDDAPEVGAVYDLRRRHHRAPKQAPSVRFTDVAQVRITDIIGDRRARAEVIKGKAKRRDRVVDSGDAQ